MESCIAVAHIAACKIHGDIVAILIGEFTDGNKEFSLDTYGRLKHEHCRIIVCLRGVDKFRSLKL